MFNKLTTEVCFTLGTCVWYDPFCTHNHPTFPTLRTFFPWRMDDENQILSFRLRSLWSYHPSCLVILLSLCGLNPLQSHAPTLHHNPEGINFLIIVLIIVTTIVNGVSIRSCLVIKFDQLDCHHHIETITWDILSSNRGLQSLIFNCDLRIRWDWGQHSHFLQCLIFEMAFCCY